MCTSGTDSDQHQTQQETGKIMFKAAASLSTGDLLVEGWFAGAPYKSRTFFLTMLLPDSRGPRTTADGPCDNGLESFDPTKNAFPLIRKMAVSGAIGGEMRGSRHQTFTKTAIMVWAAISADGKSQIIQFNGIVTARRYQDEALAV